MWASTVSLKCPPNWSSIKTRSRMFSLVFWMAHAPLFQTRWWKHLMEGLFSSQHSFRRASESFLPCSGRGGVAALWMLSSTKEQISTNRTPVTSDSPQTLKSKSFPQVQPHAGLQSSIFKAPKSSSICSSDEREKDEKVEYHSVALHRHRTNYGSFWLLMAGELAARSASLIRASLFWCAVLLDLFSLKTEQL